MCGGNSLSGSVKISGSKNGSLPIMAAALLFNSPVFLSNIPYLLDVNTMAKIISSLGGKVDFRGNSEILIDPSNVSRYDPPLEPVIAMRASFLVAGALLARFGRAKVALPGGCAIGSRPVDIHLKGFEALGVKRSIEHGFVNLECDKLKGANIYLSYPSVGATENLIMASVFAEGMTVIDNAAKEPEILGLSEFLNLCGAKIRGAGSRTIEIEGVKSLKPIDNYTIIPDRIEAGTLMLAGAITRGDILVENISSDYLSSVIEKMIEAGIEVLPEKNGIRVRCNNRPKPVTIKTSPHPGFPTDMQAQFMALLSLGEGTSVITEMVFENRYLHAEELSRLGADIRVDGRTAVVVGVDHLSGAPVRALDLRAGAALVIAGLMAEGETRVFGLSHLNRGYENLEIKLSNLGACISKEVLP
ncbi:MAG: UDP-N-acetylglucosamine 1-carboxyvinyltransferase [Fervidicoccus fontis]|nr:UDP-N-acetylglucosamine 1-carboxyvinyltransferase [Thermodesulfobium acidiphilum]PMB76897.1 MAG: UDP-N-acetylglucosamine 1-carboxyvinyltransferase [Fervidicoccus fontis]HEM55598.1 UDP-N-acetylglucosamine 1-carboxyvinyltransferase [Thermodesulfobium narugense]